MNAQTGCRCCGSEKTVEQDRIDSPGRAGTILKCPDCEALSFFPSGCNAEYDVSYYGKGDARVTGPGALIRNACTIARSKMVRSIFGETGHCLDIGCGDGAFLQELRNKGWTVTGFELPGVAFERSRRKLGDCVHCGNDFSPMASAGSLDLITLWQVFEHQENPQEVLRKCFALLREGGGLVIGVPNPDSWQAIFGRGHWLHWDPPWHMQLMNPTALSRMLENAGFERLAIRFPWFEFGPIGWIQTFLNRLGLQRDAFFRELCLNDKTPISTWITAIALAAPACILSWMEAFASRSATFEVICRKRGKGKSTEERLS